MNNITCIIVDDEPLSHEILEKYISDTPGLELIGVCFDSFHAMKIIKDENPDLVFLDINMPKLSGLQMIKSLENPPKVIFTTAYPEYAVEGFEVNAIDYLLKPFDYARFIRSVNKLSSGNEETKQNDKALWLRADKKIHKIKISDIYYIEAIGDYLKFYTRDLSLVVHERMKKMEIDLADFNFIRVHRSFIVSIDKIEFVEGNRIKILDQYIPIGQTYRENFFKKIN